METSSPVHAHSRRTSRVPITPGPWSTGIALAPSRRRPAGPGTGPAGRDDSAGPDQQRLLRLASPIGLLLRGGLACRGGLIPARVIAAPSALAEVFAQMLASGELQSHLVVSLGPVVQGLAIAITLGTLLALVAGLSRRGEAEVDTPMQIWRALGNA